MKNLKTHENPWKSINKNMKIQKNLTKISRKSTNIPNFRKNTSYNLFKIPKSQPLSNENL